MFRLYGIRSCIVVPLEAGERVLGGLAVGTTGADRALREPFTGWLRLVAEVFASALERTAMEDALRASEGMKSAILSSLSNGVAVLDSDGTIVAVSQSWTIEGATVGSNYVTAWREAARAGASHGSDAAAGIAAVLARERDSFAFEYTARDPTAERWYSMVVVPLNQPAGGAVISHTDVTERKRAEANAQRSRQELAHFTRVSTMGALAASLAHELNQPLAAILSNAQAARRFLGAARPDLDEIRSILSDIVEDDKRAGEVIEGLRELLRKGETEVVPLDLNALIRDVVKLLGSDALIRRVRMHLDVAAEPLIVAGDRIQLQQVVLNLQCHGRYGRLPHGGTGRLRANRAVRWPDGARVRPGHRAGDPRRPARSALRALLHDQAHRHGHGPVDFALDHRGARRPHLGDEQPGPRSDLQLRHADPQRHGDVSRNGARIIVVDDDISVRRALSRLLISAGYRVQTFESARDVLMNGDLGRAACVIVDVRMPGPGGLELQEILSQVPVPIPIIFITGNPDVPTAVKAMKAGAVDFLSKPVSEEELFGAVERALALRPASTDQRHMAHRRR